MKRYKEFVFSKENGINLKDIGRISRTTNKMQKKLRNLHNYKNPPIPEGYKYICGKWYNGFIIERYYDGSQFVWIPVGYLDSDGTLDEGRLFNKRFGRRKYWLIVDGKMGFYEPITEEFTLQKESVNKYGGFYISRYNISKNKITNQPQSVKGEMPWINVDFNDAQYIAKTFEIRRDTITSHLTFGTEYDSVLAWFIKSKKLTYEDIIKDSTKWGNYWKTENSPKKIVETGSREEWCVNGICDFAGNVSEWTQEQLGDTIYVYRGGNCFDDGDEYPVACREDWYDSHRCSYIGFRCALCIK